MQRTHIQTYTEGFTVYTSDGSKLTFNWNEITHCGVITSGKTKDYVFAYAENIDQIVQLPPVFCDFETFKEELKENAPYKTYELNNDETIIDHLKKLLGVTSKK